jgi:hypothetical protein
MNRWLPSAPVVPAPDSFTEDGAQRHARMIYEFWHLQGKYPRIEVVPEKLSIADQNGNLNHSGRVVWVVKSDMRNGLPRG